MLQRSGFSLRAAFVFKALCVVLLIAVLAGSIYERVGRRRDRQRLTQIGRSVDIGGRALNLYCSGEGTPTVILDSGAGDPGFAWSHIQLELAKTTRACWYDRAGEGWSDPGPFPRTSEAMAKDLHELVRRAHLPAPYVLVGHSLGGMNARVYNGLYPNDVAGVVLVDAAHQDELRLAPDFMLTPFHPPRYLWRPIWVLGQTAAAVGIIRLMTPRLQLAAEPGQRTRAQVVQALRQQPKALAARWDATLPESYAQAERAGGFGDKPLIVLTRGNVQVPAISSTTDREYVAYEQVWMHEIQPKLARLSICGRQIVVDRSGHRMHDEAPEAIIAAVRDVVVGVRRPTHLTPEVPPPGQAASLATPGSALQCRRQRRQ